MIVTVTKLNKRRTPIVNLSDKSNVIGTVNKGFTFESVNELTNTMGRWYEDRDGFFYWGGGLAPSTTSFAAPIVNPVGLTPDDACITFIKQREGLRLNAYQDSAGVWTIGYGTIIYEDRTPVRRGDVITNERAEQLLQVEIVAKSAKVNSAIGDTSVNQQQYDALVSFAYNIGIGGLLSSTLLKKVRANPYDATIRDSFMVWDKAHMNGVLVEVQGLKTRRKDEADLYFS